MFLKPKFKFEEEILCENNSGGRDNPTTIDTDNTHEINLNSISKDQAGVNNVSQGSTHKRIPRTRRRRQNKALRRKLQSLESKEGADSSVEVVEKGRQTTLSNGSGGQISSGCLKNTLERESSAGHVTSVNAEEDKLVEMRSDGCSDIKHASGDSMNGTEIDNSEDIKDGFAMEISLPDLSGEDFKQVKRAKLNVDQNVLYDVHSADALLEESKRIPRTRRRRRNKALRRKLQSLESKEDVDSSVEVVEKGRQTTLSNGSGGAISPGCLKNSLERESGIGHVTSANAEEDKLVEMRSDGCSDIKHASGDSMNGTEMDNSEDIKDGFAMEMSLPDLSGEDFKQVKRAKLNVNQNVLFDVHSADAPLEESKRISKTCRRRRNKALRLKLQSLESKEGADSSVEVVEKGRQTTLSNGSGGAISPGCLKNTLERESGTGHVTSVNAEEDKLVEMRLDGCSDIKHARGDSMNGTEMDNSEDIKIFREKILSRLKGLN